MTTTPIPEATLEKFDDSLQRCLQREEFLDRFYQKFLNSSDEVRKKFADTDFTRQKRALRASFHLILLAAGEDEENRETYLKDVAERHSRKQLDVGAAFYDLWLDSLLATVKESDPQFDKEVEQAWERVMWVGIDYLLGYYNR